MPERCVTALKRASACPKASSAAGPDRVVAVRLLLDSRYPKRWQNFKDRLVDTFQCVNKLYEGHGLQWTFGRIEFWDPGATRHDLRALLDRIGRQYPADDESLVVGITVWEKEKVYSKIGGEIGLSRPKRGIGVVPAWPRVENDCMTLAHELGHIAGAMHVPGKRSLMHWSGSLFYLPAKNPTARVTGFYRIHPRNREALRVYASSPLTKYGFAPSRVCQAYLVGVDRCWGLAR